MRSNRAFHFLVVAAVGMLLVFQVALQLSGHGFSVANLENRAKASRPKFELRWNTIREMENFYNDHFALRDALIQHLNELRYGLFGSSPVAKVLLGKNGWLYYNTERNIESYRNVDPLPEAELDAFYEKHEARARELAAHGVLYVFVVGPNNQTIYPESLPDWARVKLGEVSRLDQIMARMRQSKNIIAVDLRPALLAEKTKHRVYYNTDTHWNSLGGYIGYREIMTALYKRTRDRDFTPVEPSALAENFVADAGGGDLARMLALPDLVRETGKVNIKILSDRKSKKKVAVIRDSFYGAMAPFFKSRFTVDFDRHWEQWSDSDIGALERGDRVVIYEKVERAL